MVNSNGEYSASGDRLLRGSNVGVNRILWDSDVTCYWPTERRNEVVDYILSTGDLVIAMDRPFIFEGFKTARIKDSDLPALLLQRVGRFRLTDNITSDYLWAFLHCESFKWQLLRMQKGTDLPHISRFDVEGVLIPALGLAEQAAVADLFSSLLAQGSALLIREDVNRKHRNTARDALVVSETRNV